MLVCFLLVVSKERWSMSNKMEDFHFLTKEIALQIIASVSRGWSTESDGAENNGSWARFIENGSNLSNDTTQGNTLSSWSAQLPSKRHGLLQHGLKSLKKNV